ncbi:hypothetical protein M422DRAFT_30729 [Sphaerobolus stellatus SS14]|uniref:Uncharacterized protein n=1 Tax=Sphaerobolus stellatus (strain SS14) TaxID=990650 RepID=A0A0C9VY74_SPHS4|nr:hypothetical protein M422DRAFT_30729 [Sphaerobolus stellatus SS14]
MKFNTVTASLSFASLALAQTFSIVEPSSGGSISPGQAFNVQIEQPAVQGIFQSVSMVIGLQRCGSSECTTTDGTIMGQILYSNTFSPVRHDNTKPPYQNFTFSIDDTQPNNGFLHATQTFLTGAGPSVQLATQSIPLKITVPAANVASAKFKRGL